MLEPIVFTAPNTYHSPPPPSSTDWPVGSSPDLQVFSKTPNRFVPVTGSRCGRRETGRWLGKVEARPTRRHRQHTSEPKTQRPSASVARCGFLVVQKVHLEEKWGWSEEDEALRNTFPGNWSDDQRKVALFSLNVSLLKSNTSTSAVCVLWGF